MLYTLQIKDFIIVEHVELQLQSGLTVVTGETGAGKSILIAALALILGERATGDVVRPQCQQAELSAAFEPSATVLTWLSEQALDSGDECLIRRVIQANGRSRAYINGHLTTVQSLRMLGGFLVDIHSQHASQSLMQAEHQRELLDAMAHLEDRQQKVYRFYQQWQQLNDALLALGGKAADHQAQMQLLRYQIDELQQWELTAENLKFINAEHRRLAYSSQLLNQGQQALHQLTEEDLSVLSRLTQVQRELNQMRTHDEQLANLVELLDGAMIQIQEAGSELNQYLNQLESNPEYLQQLNQTLAQLQDMARKHQVAVAQLPQHLQHLLDQLACLEAAEQQAVALEQQLLKVKTHYFAAAQQLSEQRQQAAENLAQRISQNIQQLGMPNGQFKISIHRHANTQPTAHGIDHVTFLISANLGQDPKPLHKVASGGELSRISLAIQVVNALGNGVPVLVFDEVDVGIGGSVAEIVGQQLAQLAQQRQVIGITHLPQVACCGQQHLKVIKTQQKQQTCSKIEPLQQNQRIEEIARMLGGQVITEQTLAHATEMLRVKML